MSDNTINQLADATRPQKAKNDDGRAQIQAQAEATFVVEYSYLKFYSWWERGGDTLVYWSRADKYHTFTHELIERGVPSKGDGVLHLNGWEPTRGRRL